MSFPFDAVAELVSRYRSLDEPTQGLPSIAPVAVVADYSRRASTEPIESRGIFGFSIAATPGNYGAFQVHAPARPVVIESLSLKTYNVGNGTYSLNLSPSFARLAVNDAAGSMSIGGVEKTAWCNAGLYGSAAAGNTQLPAEAAWITWPPNADLRLLVPVGWIFSGQYSFQNERVEGVIVYREILT